MKDSEIKEIFNIPNSTLYDWKKRDDYRKKILEFLKELEKNQVLEILKSEKRNK